MLMNRIKQFYQQLTLRMEPRDIDFVKKYLSTEEQLLFNKLSSFNQKHSIEVTYTLLTMYPEAPIYLIKAALLHDIGKSMGKQFLLLKVLSVLCFSLFPRYSLAFAKKHKQSFLYYYYFHPQLSEKMLQDIHSSPEIIHIVKNHHGSNKDPEIRLLQKADELH